MPTYRGGRHENGQNYLIDHRTLAQMQRLVADTEGPIVEIGPGRGALTKRLQRLGRPLTAVELDSRLVPHLRHVLWPDVELVVADFLAWRMPGTPHVVVGNLPFHLTTAVLRKVLHAPAWTDAIFLVQWEVARRRAGVGGASMMTAQWWPWIEFGLEGRVPRTAFRPAPNVDGGLFTMARRTSPLIEPADRTAYRRFVHQVFTGPGRGVAEIAARAMGPQHRRSFARAVGDAGIDPRSLPKDLTAEQWVTLFHVGERFRAVVSGSRQRRGRSAAARA